MSIITTYGRSLLTWSLVAAFVGVVGYTGAAMQRHSADLQSERTKSIETLFASYRGEQDVQIITTPGD